MTTAITSAVQTGVISTQVERVQSEQPAPQQVQEQAPPPPPPSDSGRGTNVDTTA